MVMYTGNYRRPSACSMKLFDARYLIDSQKLIAEEYIQVIKLQSVFAAWNL